MIHKFLLYRLPQGTALSLRTCIWSLNFRRLGRYQTFSSCANITSKQQTSLMLQPRSQALLNISNFKRSMSDVVLKKSLSRKQSRTRYSQRFLEFHKSIKCSEDDFTMSHSEWDILESEILTESPNLEAGLDYSIMKSLNALPDLSLSFFNYIKSKRSPNMSVLTEFFKNCCVKYEDIVIDEFEKVMKTNDIERMLPVMPLAGNRVAISISKTRAWRQSIQLLNFQLDENFIPELAVQACSQIFKQALKERDYKAFFDVWTSMLPLRYRCDTELISRAFYESWKEGVIPVDVLFELLKLEELPLQDYQMKELQKYCESTWADVRATYVNRKSRICSTCSEKLPEYEAIDSSVFEKIRKQVLHNLANGENVYHKSNSKEVKSFTDLMYEQKQPFDYVIDAENVIYMQCRPKEFQPLISMVNDLNRNGKRVLVIMKQNRKELVNSLQKLGTSMVLYRRTHDDCYIILAALMSGPKCFVVTNDTLKDHMELLDANLKPYFSSWRDHRLVMHNTTGLLHPPSYSWQAHESEKAWHIPYTKPGTFNEKSTISYLFERNYSKSFFCVKKLNHVSSPELTFYRKSKNELVKK